MWMDIREWAWSVNGHEGFCYCILISARKHSPCRRPWKKIENTKRFSQLLYSVIPKLTQCTHEQGRHSRSRDENYALAQTTTSHRDQWWDLGMALFLLAPPDHCFSDQFSHSLWPAPTPSQCTLPFSQTELLSEPSLRPILLRCGKLFLAFHWPLVGSLHSRRSNVCLYRQIYIFQIWVCFFSLRSFKKNDYLGATSARSKTRDSHT